MTKLIKLYKNNCDPCIQLSNFLDAQKIEHESFNIMDNTDLAVKYGIMSVPVLILVDDEGNEIKRTFGYKPHEVMQLASQQ